MNWNSEQIIALASDETSAQAGRGLANLAKWQSTGGDDKTVWGECRGSGKNPYQVVIDLTEPAFKCTCPSRKFPCKHALGLFLLFAANSVKSSEPPAFAAEWLAKRQQTEARKQEKAQTAETPEEAAKREKSRAKRADEREAKVAQGLQELELWLKDLVRAGLATAQTQPLNYWEKISKRLIDAQAPGAAALVRAMSGAANSGDGWTDKLLAQMGSAFLLCESYKRIENLPAPIQADVRAAVGWTIKEDELENAETVRDDWQVLGQRVYEADKLRVQRTWLCGEKSNRDALVLNFAVKNQPHAVDLIVGSQIDATLKFYPGNFPLRAAVGERHGEWRAIKGFAGHRNFAEFMNFTAHAFGRNAWLENVPARLANAVAVFERDQWFVRDTNGKLLPLAREFACGLDYSRAREIEAISGGAPFDLFGEWNGEALFPLVIWHENKLFAV